MRPLLSAPLSLSLFFYCGEYYLSIHTYILLLLECSDPRRQQIRLCEQCHCWCSAFNNLFV
jgi:hypothetical protein